MRLPLERDESTKRHMALSAAAMFAGATFLGLSQALTAEGPSSSVVPGFLSLGFVCLLLTRGTRLPTLALAAVGPIGVAMIGVALATSPGAGDGALLYIWPVLWVAYFFGLTGTILIVAAVGLIHALVLVALPPESAYLDRWFDVVVSVGVVAAVVQTLSKRNSELLERFAAEARLDTLTGLLNRRGFEERVPSELARAARDQASVAVVSFDIDYFKRVNDEWGHEAGDIVLVRLADVFREQTRGSDVVVRMGGEEFVALLWSSDLGEAVAYAERVRTAFATGCEMGASPTISAGVAAALAPTDLDRLLQEADSALYAAKCAGRDRAVVHPHGAAPMPADPALAGNATSLLAT